jgi:predicted Mrr-cat superfamily restriction endonuclease
MRVRQYIFQVGKSISNYHHHNVWREKLEVAMKVKGSQSKRRVKWVDFEHPFTAINSISEVYANHGGSPK